MLIGHLALILPTFSLVLEDEGLPLRGLSRQNTVSISLQNMIIQRCSKLVSLIFTMYKKNYYGQRNNSSVFKLVPDAYQMFTCLPCTCDIPSVARSNSRKSVLLLNLHTSYIHPHIYVCVVCFVKNYVLSSIA